MPHRLMDIVRLTVPLLLCNALLLPPALAQSALPDHPQPQQSLPDAPSAVVRSPRDSGHQPLAPATRAPQRVDNPWPREATRGDEKISMYQPQLETWQGDELRAYAALSVVNKNNKTPKYGVLWFTARTEVDKVNRQVTLDNFQITKVKFPTLKSKEAEYQAFLQAKLPGKSRIIALDRLEAALAASDSELAGISGLPVKNDPPRIIFTTKPLILVLIDGPIQFRDVGGTDLRLALNTRAVILFDTRNNKYYLNVMDGWLEAPDLMSSQWSYVSKIPDDMKEITAGIRERQQTKAPEGPPPPSLGQASKGGKIPAIHVSLGPAELLVTEGSPQLEPIPEARLEYVKNTTANILRDASLDYYILVSGRWFRSKSLEDGPWEFIDAKNLPEGFGLIPESSPKSGVLVSVPGTGPAKEALIANSIPQTATITRKEAQLQVQYDGDPQFNNIEGTELKYAVNTATPVIQVDDNYYAVQNAVWFVGRAPVGPWEVATQVPPAIYLIPPSSSLHYVTYAKVYRSTPDVVYVGYTPGYYGTVVSSTTTTVVYGTGWYYPPHVGHYWYGAPYTYGVGVASTWSSGTGWSITIGVGYTYGYPYYPYYPWWGPWGYYGACCWGPVWGYGYGGYASTNVYGRWGNAAYANTRAAWANPYTGNYGAASRTTFQNTPRGTVGVAGRGANANIYTGNTAAGRGAVGYNPTTGVVAGGGAGYAGNMYTGQGAAGRGAFAYNTNSGAGIAAGNNNVFASKDGTVYRYDRQSSNWSQNSGNGWHSASKSQPGLQQQQQARVAGQQRTQNFSRSMGGGMRGGGGRRR